MSDVPMVKLELQGSISIPPAIDLAHIAAFLSQTQQQWEYVDPTYAEVYGEE